MLKFFTIFFLATPVKALEVQEEKAAMQAYGSSDSGASLGDILGAALQEKQMKQRTKILLQRKKSAPKKAVATEETLLIELKKPAKKKAAPKKAVLEKTEDAEDEA